MMTTVLLTVFQGMLVGLCAFFSSRVLQYRSHMDQLGAELLKLSRDLTIAYEQIERLRGMHLRLQGTVSKRFSMEAPPKDASAGPRSDQNQCTDQANGVSRYRLAQLGERNLSEEHLARCDYCRLRMAERQALKSELVPKTAHSLAQFTEDNK